MSALQVFEQGQWSVTTIDLDGQPWFYAKDVTAALGYVNGRDAVAKNCPGAASW